MSDKEPQVDIQFFQLVLSLQAAAMQQMGKTVSPISGQIERDLNGAKTSIDLIEMLEKKTKGNLSDEEAKLIKHVLYELRMNYIDETKKPGSEVPKDSAPSADTDQEDTSSDSSEKPSE